MKKVLVLNEMHPTEQPGAATIALEYALALASKADTVFMYTSEKSSTTQVEDLNMVSIARSTFLLKIPTFLRGYAKVLLDLFNFPRALKVMKHIDSFRPDQVWIHQIGNDIPRLLVPFLSRRYNVLITLHDFGLIVPRKLYPTDLSNSLLRSLEVLNPETTRRAWLPKYIKLSLVFYIFRRAILRFYFKKAKLISISALQSEIHSKFGFYMSGVVSNGIDICDCNFSTPPNRDERILFVGRLIGKGFPRLLRSVRGDGTKLSVVGGDDVETFLFKNDVASNSTFLGRMNRDKIFAEMHKVMFVYVASDCFDVFPTVGLEAIRHGAIPITSDTTGIRDLVRQIDDSLVLPSGSEVFYPSRLFDRFEDHYPKEQIEKVNSQISNVDAALEQYAPFI